MARRTTTNTCTRINRYKAFLDTSAWCALASDNDKYYSVAVGHNDMLRQTKARLLTSDYVLDETITRLRYDFGYDAALAFWKGIRVAVDSGRLQILRVDEAVWEESITLFIRYNDQKFSFTDCTSFVLAQQTGVDEVFGFDAHFRLFGLLLQPTS